VRDDVTTPWRNGPIRAGLALAKPGRHTGGRRTGDEIYAFVRRECQTICVVIWLFSGLTSLDSNRKSETQDTQIDLNHCCTIGFSQEVDYSSVGQL